MSDLQRSTVTNARRVRQQNIATGSARASDFHRKAAAPCTAAQSPPATPPESASPDKRARILLLNPKPFRSAKSKIHARPAPKASPPHPDTDPPRAIRFPARWRSSATDAARRRLRNNDPPHPALENSAPSQFRSATAAAGASRSSRSPDTSNASSREANANLLPRIPSVRAIVAQRHARLTQFTHGVAPSSNSAVRVESKMLVIFKSLMRRKHQRAKAMPRPTIVAQQFLQTRLLRLELLVNRRRPVRSLRRETLQSRMVSLHAPRNRIDQRHLRRPKIQRANRSAIAGAQHRRIRSGRKANFLAPVRIEIASLRFRPERHPDAPSRRPALQPPPKRATAPSADAANKLRRKLRASKDRCIANAAAAIPPSRATHEIRARAGGSMPAAGFSPKRAAFFSAADSIPDIWP